jgi:tetratricopeptide (TPR) repeat protein
MRRTMMLLALLAALLVALAVAGCKDGRGTDSAKAKKPARPATPLEKFAERITKLEGQALTDTLRHLAAGGPPQRAYASYLLGNRFYLEAGDSARARGWKDTLVTTLLDSAEVRFTAAIAADSTLLEPMVNLGSLWDDRSEQTANQVERQDAATKAESFYRMALKVDPLDEKARCNLGSLYLRQRQHGKAIAEFKQVLADNPQSALAHYNLAIMFAESKVYREALAEWDLAVKYDPDGDVGSRSAENIKIVKDLMNAPDPTLAH